MLFKETEWIKPAGWFGALQKSCCVEFSRLCRAVAGRKLGSDQKANEESHRWLCGEGRCSFPEGRHMCVRRGGMSLVLIKIFKMTLEWK